MRLTRRVADDIRRAVAEGLPGECCGIVLADPGSPELGVSLLPSPNVAAEGRRRRYRLDHRVHLLAVDEEIRGAALILGYYHSHAAGPAVPSRSDAELAVPGVTYLIASAAGMSGHLGSARNGAAEPFEVRAWRSAGRAFEEEAIVVEEPAHEENGTSPCAQV